MYSEVDIFNEFLTIQFLPQARSNFGRAGAGLKMKLKSERHGMGMEAERDGKYPE